MRGFLAVITVSMFVTFGATSSITEPCNAPHIAYDEYLVIKPDLQWYESKYSHGARIIISCKKLYLYDNDNKEFIKFFAATCKRGSFDPEIKGKRFSCRKLDPVCKLELTPNLEAKPDKETFKRGELVEFSCKIGYYLVGARDAVCFRNGQFSEDIPNCRPLCVKPAPQPYLIIDYDSRSFKRGGSIDFDCEDGYRLRDDVEQTRFCTSSGTWDPEIEKNLCEKLGCPKAPELENGKYYPAKKEYEPDRDGWYKVGARLNYECNEYYYLKGKDHMVCRANGKFVFKVPECIEIRCDKPMEISKGYFSPEQNSYAINGYVDYRCNTNYRLSTASGRRYCRANDDGKTANFQMAPMCRRIECDKPDDIDKGGFKPGEGPYYVGDKVVYKCFDGYYLDRSGLSVCLLNKNKVTASFTPAPKCKRIICNEPMSLKNGEISDGEKDEYYIGDVVTYKCSYRFYLVGSDQAKCVQTGIRTGKFTKAPFCKEILCLKPMDLDKGYFTPDEEAYPIGDDVSYFCNENYKRVGPPKAVCEKKGPNKAEFTSAPICKRIECEEPMDLENGDFVTDPKGPFTVGTVIKYKCNRGFEFITKFSTTICKLEKGGMSAKFTKLPVCERVYCDNPGYPDNGGIKPNKPRYIVDESVMFVCDDCYKIKGTEKATCQQNGKFDKPVPSCEIRTCSKLVVPYPTDGFFDPIEPTYKCGESVTFSCHEAFILINDKKSTCQPDGTFSIYKKAMCDPIICKRPALNPKVRVRPNRREYEYKFTIRYSCAPGYSVVETDKTKAVCQKDGTFSNPSITCKPNKCGRPPVPVNGYILDDTSQPFYDPGDEIEYECDRWYTLVTGGGSDGFNECQNDGTWRYPAPICAPPSCKGNCFSKPKKDRPCQCDHKCASRYDCCSDRDKFCLPHSCGGRCGKPVPGGCSCDARCTQRLSRNCCRDYLDACPGEWYLFPTFP